MRWIIIGSASLLCACTSGQPQTTVAAIEIGLTAAESAAYQYVTLPDCGSTGATVICKSAPIVAQIKAADQQAFVAIMAAKTQSASGGNPNLTAATAALSAFQAILATLPKGN